MKMTLQSMYFYSMKLQVWITCLGVDQCKTCWVTVREGDKPS